MDAGNSRLKLQQIKAGKLQRVLSVSWLSVSEPYIQSVLAGQVLLFSSVVQTDRIYRLTLKASCVFKIDAALIADVTGFTSNYTKVTQLGVDRLLISYAASCLFPQHQRCMLVSMGTATTVEIVQSDRHCGGYIAPGIALLYQSLRSTAKLPQLSAKVNTQLGITTQGSITAGITAMQQGLIRELQIQHQPDIVIFTGGYASTFATLHANVKVMPNLLFYALQQLAVKLNLEDIP